MENAAERLLGLELTEIKELAKDIIFGQMRVVIAIMNIRRSTPIATNSSPTS